MTMRLFLLPISTRRTLIYCQRLNVATPEQTSLLDKATTRAAALWAGWEKKESGWQRKVVDYGNAALKRIPYEEWGLKSIPPLTKKRQSEEVSAKDTVEVAFPSSLIPEANVLGVLKQLGTERQKLHRTRMIYCYIGMPISAPFALVPVCWSHWRALSGSRHVEFLLDKKLIAPKASPILDELYASGKLRFDAASKLNPGKSQEELKDLEEEMVLHKSDGTRIAQALELPELDIELDRAVWQVEKALHAAKELKEEEKGLNKAAEKQKSK